MDEQHPTPARSTERPVECPKGHDLWWFHALCDGRHYALCAQCPTVWGWFERDEPLIPCHGFNRVTLIQALRSYGMVEGHFPRATKGQLRDARRALEDDS